MSKFVTLVEIDFESGTRYYSFQGVNTPTQAYQDGLIAVSPILREIGHLSREYTVGDVTIQLDNSSREFSTLKTSEPFRNRTVRILFGDLAGGFAALTRVFTGKVGWIDFNAGVFTLIARDTSFDRFNTRIEDRVEGVTITRIYPVIYGRVSSFHSGSNVGAVPAYRVSDAPITYVPSNVNSLAANPIEALIERVFAYRKHQDPSGIDRSTVGTFRAPGIELITNGGFEKGDINWDTDANRVIQTSNANSHVGNRHLEVTATTGMPSGINDCVQLDNSGNALLLPVGRLSRVNITGFIQRVSGDGTGYFLINWYNASRTYVSTTLSTGVTAGSYSLSFVTIDVPDDTIRFAEFGCRVDAAAADTVCRFDAFSGGLQEIRQTIEFATDPRDVDRPDEEEVWTDHLGFFDSLTGATRALITNPVKALQHYLEHFVLIEADAIDQTAFDNAADVADQLGLEIGGAVTDGTLTHLEIITQIITSFNLIFFLDRDGKYSLALPSLGDIGDPTTLTALTDEHDILRGSFIVRSFNDIANRLQYNYAWNEQDGYFERQPDVTDKAEKERVGEDLRVNFNFWFVRNSTSALATATGRLRCFREDVEFAEFQLPIDQFTRDINDVVRITHYQGMGASGYVDAIFRIISISLDLNPSSMNVFVRAVKLANLTGSNLWLQYMRLGDRTTLAATWGAASDADKQYAYLGDDTETAGDVKGTLGTTDPIKVLY